MDWREQQAKAAEVAEQIAELMNQLEELGGGVAPLEGRLRFNGGQILRFDMRWTVRTGR
jgi:hypothetical protein